MLLNFSIFSKQQQPSPINLKQEDDGKDYITALPKQRQTEKSAKRLTKSASKPEMKLSSSHAIGIDDNDDDDDLQNKTIDVITNQLSNQVQLTNSNDTSALSSDNKSKSGIVEAKVKDSQKQSKLLVLKDKKSKQIWVQRIPQSTTNKTKEPEQAALRRSTVRQKVRVRERRKSESSSEIHESSNDN